MLVENRTKSTKSSLVNYQTLYMNYILTFNSFNRNESSAIQPVI